MSSIDPIDEVHSPSEEEDDDDEAEEEINMHELLSQFFVDSKKGKNVCDVLVEIKKTLEIQNKIMVELLKKSSHSLQ